MCSLKKATSGSRLFGGHRGLVDRVDQSGLGVHLGDEITHLAHLFGTGVNDEVRASAITLRSSSVMRVAISMMT